MSSRGRSRCVKVRTPSGKSGCRRIDRSCSPYLSRSHPKYCDCDECYLLYEEPGYRLPSWLSPSNLLNTRSLTPVLSLGLFFVVLRTIAFTFPYGLFKSTAYGFEMGSVGSRVLFTLQQHIWSMIPLIFGGSTGTVTYTLHLILNTVVISTFLTDVYMKYISSVIITSTVYTLLSRYSDSSSWRSFFNFPRRFINASLTVLCIKYAMDTKTLTGVNTNE